MLNSKLQADTGIRSDAVEFGMAGAMVDPKVRRQAHRHNEIELNFVKAGKIDFLFGNYRYVLGEGAFYAFWAAVPHNIVAVDKDSKLLWLTVPFEKFIHWRLSDRLIEFLFSPQLIADFSREHQARDRINFDRWIKDLESGDPRSAEAVMLEVEARMVRLESSLSFDQASGQSGVRENPLRPANLNAHKMAMFICDHYREPLTVSDISACVNLHPNYAMKLFKAVYGTNIGGFLARYRVVQAQRMLLLTDMKADAIAMEAGFGSKSQFYAAFKKYTLKSPHKFRNFD